VLDKTEGPLTECITPQVTSTQQDSVIGYQPEAMYSLEVGNSSFHQPKEQEEATQEQMDLLVEYSKNRLIKLNKWQKEERNMEICSNKIKTI
jgi:hypothetical protein